MKIFIVHASQYAEDGFKVVAAFSEIDAQQIAAQRPIYENVVFEIEGVTADGEPRELVLS